MGGFEEREGKEAITQLLFQTWKRKQARFISQYVN